MTSGSPGLEGLGAARLREGGERIVLTGAGGWLSLATLELLRDTLGAPAFEARIRCFGSSARALALRGGVSVPQQPLAAIAALPPAPTIVLHHAFLTKDKAEAMDEAAYVAANCAIRETVLAALDPIGARAVFVPSSGAARAADDPAAAPAMRLYGALKRDDEDAFAAWAERAGARAVIARVFNLSGPYINKHAAYALASFVLDALAGRAIEVKAQRPVLRSYVAIRELMSIVFGLLTGADADVVRFDTAGEEILEMADVARVVDAALGGAGVRRARIIRDDADRYVGDAAAYRAIRAEQQVTVTPFERQVRETAAYLADPAKAEAVGS